MYLHALESLGQTPSYDDKLNEALTRLRPGFGQPHKTGRFDHYNWEHKPDPDLKRYGMFVLKPGRDPSRALKAAVDESSTKWDMDCALFVQVANLYALSQIDPTGFDRKWKNKGFRLRYHWSDGLRTKYFFRRERKSDPWKALYGGRFHTLDSSKWNEASILDDKIMPRGSRIMWSNERAPIDFILRNESTVKVGADRYRAFGLLGTLSGYNVKFQMAKEYFKKYRDLRPGYNAKEVSDFAKNHVFLKEATSFRRP